MQKIRYLYVMVPLTTMNTLFLVIIVDKVQQTYGSGMRNIMLVMEVKRKREKLIMLIW